MTICQGQRKKSRRDFKAKRKEKKNSQEKKKRIHALAEMKKKKKKNRHDLKGRAVRGEARGIVGAWVRDQYALE